MKKRTLALAALTAAMTLGMSLTSFAAEEPTWIVPKDLKPSQYMQMYGTDNWNRAEAIAQAKAWANANKGDIVGIQDQKAQYEAIVKKVCNFLSYDVNYTGPHIAYTIRDGRGVCADYTALTAALCEEVGIDYQILVGTLSGTSHDMLIVTVGGQSYYSDPTNYDSGAVGILLTSPTPGFTALGTTSGLSNAVGYTGGDVGSSFSLEIVEAAKSDQVPIKNKYGTFYISQKDSAEFDACIDRGDVAGAYVVLDRNNIPHN